MSKIDKKILSDVRYPRMKEIIEEQLSGPIVDAPDTISLGSGGPMRGDILRGQANRILRASGYSDDEIRQAWLRFNQKTA